MARRTLRERIHDGDFNLPDMGPAPSKRAGASRDERIAFFKKHQAAQREREESFKVEALCEVGLDGHPKADKAFSMAWDLGHANGYSEVLLHLEDLAKLLLD